MPNFQNSKITQSNSKSVAFTDYVPAQFYPGVDSYVGYYVLDPISKVMIRKRIKLNYIKNKVERRKIAVLMVQKINDKLAKGWNPLIELSEEPSFRSFNEATDLYLKSIERSLKNDLIRKASYDSVKLILI